MNEAYEKRIQAFIAEHHIQAEHLHFEHSCHSVAEAAEAAGASPQDFVKNICMLDPHGRLLVAIVRGEDRVSLENTAAALGIEGRLRMASAEEILAATGYPCGGTPSFGFEALFIMDERVFEKTLVYTGGGSENSLIRASPHELRRANQGIIAHVRK